MTDVSTTDMAAPFRALIAQALGLRFDDDKLAWLGRILQKRVGATNSPSVAHYLHGLTGPDSAPELGVLAQALTVNETYFFRNIEQFHALRDVVLARFARHGAPARPLRLLSAGCATGEEAYSLAMTLEGAGLVSNRDFTVHAVDINPAVVAKGREARYGEWSMRETPDDLRQRWFRSEGDCQVLDERIRAAVCFEERNLAQADAAFWQSECFDVVFCRNVLMYFAPEQIKAVLGRFTHSLAPGAYLFLGHAESLRGLSPDFHLQHTHGTFYYQRKPHADEASATAVPTPVPGEWVHAIGQAADRVRALTTPSPLTPMPVLDTPVADATLAMAQALALFRQERFGEALDKLLQLPAEAAASPAMRLLHAMLLVHAGQMGEAEALCRQMLAHDDSNADAHHALALCREGAGDRQGAMDSDQTAAYLDPAFAMPHLHLGLMARRAGDQRTVRRELTLALRLLSREDDTRLQLFAGGFSRHTLSSLCKTELAASGGA